MNPNPHVCVAHGCGAYDNVRHALEQLDPTNLADRRVLVKPNAGRMARPGSGMVTDFQAVAAVIDVLQDRGATVAVGESPIIGVKALEALECTGIAEVARDRGVPLIDLDEEDPGDLVITDGTVLDRLRVCRQVLQHDLVVSVAVMKTHMHTGASLSIKNMKGCLWRRTKVRLHQLPPVDRDDCKPLDLAIADLATVLAPDLAVIDGHVGMEGLGPSAGAAKPANLAVVSSDPVAADVVACRLMGLSPDDVPHLRLAAEKQVGIADLDQLHITPDNWAGWTVTFARPPHDLSIEFPRVRVLDCNSCSACQSTLLLFLQRYGDQVFDYFPLDTELTVAIGKGHDELPAGTLCLGNCVAKHRNRGTFVPGCPPVASDILIALTGKNPDDA